MAVIKIGTGTAGAVFTDAKKEPGLHEWGKIILDLAAKPDKKFPAGVANHYLSDKTMPALFASFLGLKPEDKGIASIELDLILDVIQNKNNKALENLQIECGIRELSKALNGTSLEGRYDIEQIRTALEHPDDKNSVEITNDIQNLYGERNIQKIVDEHCADYRIGNILPISRSELENCVKPTGKDNANCQEKLEEWQGMIERAADTMGNYLGDFIILLYDLHQTWTKPYNNTAHNREVQFKILLGGGVLSGLLGDIAKKAAKTRIELYDKDTLEVTLNPPLITIRPKSKSKDSSRDFSTIGIHEEQVPENRRIVDKDKDHGTYGAAIWGVISFLHEKKEKGLREIERELLQFKPNDSIEVHQNELKIKKYGQPPCDDINFRRYALTDKDVKRYLTQYGKDLGLYTLSTGDGEAVKYTRW